MATKPSSPDLTGLSHEQKDILILRLLARLEALESKVNKDSSNSSKPPCGQTGRKGSTLKQALQPTERIDHPLPGHCDHCHHALPLQDIRKVSSWLGHASMQTTEMDTRVYPSAKLEALESVVAPKLRSGRFKATDKLIATLKEQTVMRRKKPQE